MAPLRSDTAKIERLAVLEETRGTGVGSRLMAHVLAEIAEHTEFTYVRLASQDPSFRSTTPWVSR